MDRIPSLGLIVLAIAVHSLVHRTVAETYVVGDKLGWLVPPGGQLTYAAWAQLYNFTVGDVLVFNFTTGQQDVAMVTDEAFLTCNLTSPVSLKTTGPANFTLNATGAYYFISTMDQHCLFGQKLAINVTDHGAPTPASPAPPRGPVTYTVGDELGWVVPPGGPSAYATWAYGKTFMVGDSLEFFFINGTQDVAEVKKDTFYTCYNITNNTLQVWPTSPAKIVLNTTGEYLFISTYPRHCVLGQKLAINVTSSTTPPAEAPSSATAGSSGPTPPPDAGSAPTRRSVGGCFLVTLVSLASVLL